MFVGPTTTATIQVIVVSSAPYRNGKLYCIEHGINLLCTPSLHDTSQQYLFQIVSDIRPKSIYNVTKMPIQAQCDHWLSHVWLQ